MMRSVSSMCILLFWGSIVTQQGQSIGSTKILDCDDAIKKAEKSGNKWQDLIWRVKVNDMKLKIAHCYPKECTPDNDALKSLQKGKSIKVLNITSRSVVIETSSQQTATHSMVFECEVEDEDNGESYFSEEQINYSVKEYQPTTCTPSPCTENPIPANGSAPERETESGKLVGTVTTIPQGKEVYAYLGIPYAKPPIDDLRFAAPKSPTPWRGTREAKEFGPACPQPDINIPNFTRKKEPENENCLFLNVFIPKYSHAKEVKEMAVMVWIHGEGLATGSSAKLHGFSVGSSAQYPAHVLAAYNDVIIVTFNYRLGILGFLNIPWTDIKGNYGLLDQVQALKWVRTNIGKFGGNPNKVTVFGEGAGAASIAFHLISPKSRGLFQKAIMQGGAASASSLSGKPSNDSVAKLAAAANCPFDSQLIACLRNKSAEEIISLHSSSSFKALMELNHPVVDGDFILDNPQKLYRNRAKNVSKDVQIIAGFTTHEASLDAFLRLGKASQDGISREESVANITRETLREGGVENKVVEEMVRSQYADLSDKKSKKTARDKIIDFQNDFMVVAPMISEAKALAKVLKSVYFYVFEHRPDFSTLPEWAGAFHGADTALVFGAPFANISALMDFLTPKYSDIEKGLSLFIMKLWTDFAKFGNPTPHCSRSPVTWPKFTASNQSYLAIDVKPKEKQKYRANQVAFWNLIPKVIKQTKRKKCRRNKKKD